MLSPSQCISAAYLQHDVEGQQREHNELVPVKQPASCVVEHNVCAGIQQSLQTNLQKQSCIAMPGRVATSRTATFVHNNNSAVQTGASHKEADASSLKHRKTHCSAVYLTLGQGNAVHICTCAVASVFVFQVCNAICTEQMECSFTSSCSGVGATSSSASSSGMVSEAIPGADDDAASAAGL